MLIERLTSLGGVAFFLALTWALSKNRRVVHWRVVLWGIGLQFTIALLILRTAPGRAVFDFANTAITRILDFTVIGSGAIFGKLATDFSFGAVFAFRVLPTIIFMSALMGVLYHFRVIQALVWLMAKAMQWTMRISGAEALSAALEVFMGIESTTGVKEYIRKMTHSELFALMTAFMSTIAGSVMAAYVSFGASAGHLLAASFMNAPAAILIAKLMVPKTGEPVTAGTIKFDFKPESINVVDAAASGASDGLRLAATIGAMLLAFISLVGMADFIIGRLGEGVCAATGLEGHLCGSLTLGKILGYPMRVAAFLMGTPWVDCKAVGELLGTKVVLNEFLAYQQLQPMIASGALQPRSVVIATYALCSFANFGSMAIIIGGISAIAPERRAETASLGLRSIYSGCVAGFLTASIAGILV